MLRIARIDNLSARPYTLVAPAFPADVMPCTPSEVYSRAVTGMCDAALLPVARLRELQDRYEPFGPYGIAAHGPAYSVRVFSRTRLESAVTSGRPVYLTPKSQTSRELFALLCRRDFGCEPVTTIHAEEAAARLLIGDEALDTSREELTWSHQCDLGQWWFDRSRLPFVFARWIVRRDLSGDERDLLRRWLEETTALAESPDGMRCLAEAGIPGVDAAEAESAARRYFSSIHARLTLADLHGLSAFLRLQEEREHDLWVKSA
ncbi:MAG TPA: hypothetical protein PKI11_09950 [Candidatus Hydrogenedentes bacterium]|nr:hypothetical protein [Candidatus Hydrogenedentota bacterium]HNT86502.1 hypothetical protein [Candidatus Hydrogenedentota bacterium]